ncbi:MAG: hypothetical protein JSV58_05695 [Candidatus Bathyarchaeota archaeon]|nr:MAG: hypothetical protein JSV58_05695 [Candidatus Bathyarchaeota archaeon]
MIDIQALSIVIAAASVVIGVIYSSFQLRYQTKARQTDLVLRLYSKWSDDKFMETYTTVLRKLEFKDYTDYVKKYGSPLSGTPTNRKWLITGLYFEGIGVLLRRKLIDIRLVDDLLSGPIKNMWEKIKPLVEAVRKQLGQPTVMEYFEFLYNEMQKREQG